MTFVSKNSFHKTNGQKGGRPKQDSKNIIELPDIKWVILTPQQHESLLKKYGYELLQTALFILDNWLKTRKPSQQNKNHYAQFRSDGWLINEAKRTKHKGTLFVKQQI